MPPRLPDSEKFIGDSDLKRWYLNMKEGSIQTAEPRLRRLKKFSSDTGISPKQLLKMTKKKRDDVIEDYIRSRSGMAGTYVNGIVGSLRSWLQFNYLDLGRKIKIKDAYAPKLEERVPTQVELREAFQRSGLKSRASQALMAHAGVRPEILANFEGNDGLLLSDLPEAEITKDSIEFSAIPTMIVVRRSLSKAGHKFLTFLGSEGCEYIKTYFNALAGKGVRLTPQMPLISKVHGNDDPTFYQEKSITEDIRRDWRPRFSWRPYILRAYFATQTLLAESHGKIPRDYRVFFMGHKGDTEARYTTNKGRLPKDLIEDMRSAYSRCLPYLQTEKNERSTKEDIQKAFREQLLIVAGYTAAEVEGIDIDSIADEEFQTMIRKRLLGTMINNGVKQRVVRIKEVEVSLGQGWEFVATLPDDKAIVRIPE